MKRLLAAAAISATVALTGVFSAAPAQALSYYQNYLVEPAYDIRSIVLLQYTAGGGGSTNSFQAFAPSTFITDPFLKTEAITDTYFLGVSNYGPEEGEPTDHLVLALDDAPAQSRDAMCMHRQPCTPHGTRRDSLRPSRGGHRDRRSCQRGQ